MILLMLNLFQQYIVYNWIKLIAMNRIYSTVIVDTALQL